MPTRSLLQEDGSTTHAVVELLPQVSSKKPLRHLDSNGWRTPIRGWRRRIQGLFKAPVSFSRATGGVLSRAAEGERHHEESNSRFRTHRNGYPDGRTCSRRQS